jgi:uncharacterized membrane protein
MEWLRLIGVVIVVLGFALRLRVTVVVLAAGIATGLVAQHLDALAAPGGDPGPGVLAMLGQAFANGRIITLFVLALPALGLLERYGLQDEARRVIRSVSAATTGRLLVVYHVFRTAVVGVGVRLGSGHVAFSRPLVVPMALAADRLDENAPDRAGRADRPDRIEEVDRVKAAAAASENYANFFGQNLFFGSPGVALVVKNLSDNGYLVSALQVSLYSIPMAAAALIVATAQYMLLDRWLRRMHARHAAAAAAAATAAATVKSNEEGVP